MKSPSYYVSLWKDGAYVQVRAAMNPFKKQKENEPIADERVCAIDTESLTWGGRLTTDLIPMAFYNEAMVVEARSPTDEPTEHMLRKLVLRFGVPRRSRSRVERKGGRGGGHDGRQGGQYPLAVAVFFNAPYDIGRLFERTAWLRAIHAGLANYQMTVSDRVHVEWKHYLDKSAPQFLWFVHDHGHEHVARVKGVDMTGYWKCSLDKALKAVGLKSKVDIGAEVADVFERPRESFTPAELEARKEYSRIDGQRTLQLYWETSRILETIDRRVITKTGLIPPSAPGAAARLMFARAFDCHPEIEQWIGPPPWAEEIGALSYFGGRAACPRPGVHRNLRTIDIKSAYPTVMCLLPDPVTAKVHKVDARDFVLDEWRGRWGSLVVSGESVDDIYPAFRTHDKNRLRYVVGKFEAMPMTIPEACIGVARGALKNLRVHEGSWIEGSPERSFLRSFVLTLFRMKEEHKGQPLGELAKLLINSAYGKLIEVQAKDVEAFGDVRDVRIPDYSDHRFARSILASLVRAANATMDNVDIDADHLFLGRGAMKKDRMRRFRKLVDEGRTPLEAYIVVAEKAFGAVPASDVPVRAIVRQTRNYKAGPYFMPTFASQITGYVSAQLGAMAAMVSAYCMDTDSVHYPIPPSELIDAGNLRDYHRIMREAGYFSAEEGVESIDGTPLGQWCAEMDRSDESLLVRPKRYSHRYEGKSGTAFKQAQHGMSRFTTPEAEAVIKDGSLPKDERLSRAAFLRKEGVHEAMRSQIEGLPVGYMQRRAPRKGRTAARSGELVGEFVSQWIQVENGPVPGTRTDAKGWVRWLPMD